MQTIDLAAVPLPMSRLVLGTMTFGDTADAGTSAALVDAALDAGINSLDTANGYAGTASETILGQLLPGRRDRIVLATKAGIYPGDAQGAPLLSPTGLRLSLTASLQRLGVADIDVFYLHQPDRSVPVAETLGGLGDLISEGLIRSYGVSNYSAWQVADILNTAERIGAPRPVLGQQMYNLVARRIEAEYAEFATTAGLATIVYNPLGAGLLTGRYRFEDDPADGRFRSTAIGDLYRDRYWNRATFEAVTALADLAGQAGLTMPELAFRWLLSKPLVSAILLGGSKVDQLRDNIDAAAAGPLDSELVERCDAVGAALAGPMPAYNR